MQVSTTWTRSWHLSSIHNMDFRYFLLTTTLLLAIGVYWYRRRRQTSYVGHHGYHPVANNQFQRDIEDGLSSNNFDLSVNVADGDSRPGLDADEVRRIMAEEGCTFDEARYIRQQRVLKRNNIDPETGLPLDPKLVTFS
jgi:hypothetical protein